VFSFVFKDYKRSSIPLTKLILAERNLKYNENFVTNRRRLPRNIRDELNQRLENGEPAGAILPWLNALPEVKGHVGRPVRGQPGQPAESDPLAPRRLSA
jgi:hypothetical protein